MPDESRRDHDRLDDELSRVIGKSAGAIPEELSGRIRGRLTADLRPVRAVPHHLVCFLGFFGVMAVFAGALIRLMGTAGVEKMSDAQTGVMSVLFIAGGVLFAFLLARQFAPALPQPIRTSLAVSLFGLLVLVATGVLFPWREPGAGWTVSWQCLIRIIVFAAVAALILAVPMRRAAMLSPSGKGAALGAAAGLTGVAIQQFACVHQQVSHLLIWHWSGIAVAAAVGAVAGRTLSRISFRHA